MPSMRARSVIELKCGLVCSPVRLPRGRQHRRRSSSRSIPCRSFRRREPSGSERCGFPRRSQQRPHAFEPVRIAARDRLVDRAEQICRRVAIGHGMTSSGPTRLCLPCGRGRDYPSATAPASRSRACGRAGQDRVERFAHGFGASGQIDDQRRPAHAGDGARQHRGRDDSPPRRARIASAMPGTS